MCNELIADLLKLDAFVTASILEKASLIAKPIRGLFAVHQGQGKQLQHWHQVGGPYQETRGHLQEALPQSITISRGRSFIAPQQTKATKPTSSASAPAVAATSLLSKSKAEIDALFGIAPAQEIVSLSQDSVEEVPLTEKPQQVVDLLSQLEMEIAPFSGIPGAAHTRQVRP